MSEFRENISWILRFYRPFKKRLITIAVQSVFVAILAAAIPYMYIHIFDGLQNRLSSSFILKYVLILVGLGTINLVLGASNAARRAQTNIELEWHFRQETFARLIHLDQGFYDKYRIGDLVTRLTDDVGRKLSWFACSGVFRAWVSFLRIVFCIVIMFYVNPRLTFIALIPFPVQLFVHIKSRNVLDLRFRTLQKVISRVNETIETCFSGIKIVQAYNMEKKQAEKFESIAGERVDAEINAEKAHIFFHSMYGYFWQLAQIIILIAGGWMAIEGSLTIGEFIAFDYYILYLVWPMYDIGGLLVGYRRASVSIKRIRELEKFVEAIRDPVTPVSPKNGSGRIVFDNVCFYRGDRKVLENISFDSKDFRMIALVGEVGSGKSSFLDLMCRFYDPDKGSVSMDGIPLPQWGLTEYRHRIGYVSQEPLLFTDTVSNNIKFQRPWINGDKTQWAASIAQLTNEINFFPQKFDTQIGLRGMTVSGGQKQRISIARALAGNPRVLILDDATAHLDAETESELWTQIYSVLPRMRIFVVSHRTATLERADIILVLKNGRIEEQGAHDELMSLKGEYHRIYSRRKLEESMV